MCFAIQTAAGSSATLCRSAHTCHGPHLDMRCVCDRPGPQGLQGPAMGHRMGHTALPPPPQPHQDTGPGRQSLAQRHRCIPGDQTRPPPSRGSTALPTSREKPQGTPLEMNPCRSPPPPPSVHCRALRPGLRWSLAQSQAACDRPMSPSHFASTGGATVRVNVVVDTPPSPFPRLWYWGGYLHHLHTA